MPSSNPFPERGVDPLSPIEQFARLLLGGALHCLLGLIIGAIAARQMRSRHLHWSWAVTALALVVLARASLGAWTATATVAALFATLRGRRWHREDIDAGGELAEVAVHRRAPLDLLRAGMRLVRSRPLEVLVAERWSRRGELLLGYDEAHRGVSIPFDSAGGGRHTLVVGATGSGKTVTQTWMAIRAIERGMGAIVVDPKGDRVMRDELRRAVEAAGRPFLEWTPGGRSVYNPYARGSETEIADKVLAGERFTEPHYLRQSQRYLGHVVRALRARGLSNEGRISETEPDYNQNELNGQTINKEGEA
jgi:hypothetical protein